MDSLIRDNDRTNHTQAFAAAFDLYAQYFASNGADTRLHSIYPTIIYVSRGLLSEITEAKQVLATIMNGIHHVEQTMESSTQAGRSTLVNPIQINAVALMEPGKLVMWETQFLQDVASQNFSKHKLTTDDVLGEDQESTGSESGDKNVQPKFRSTSGKVSLFLIVIPAVICRCFQMFTVNATSNSESACLALLDVVALLEHSSYTKWASTNENSDRSTALPKVHFTLAYDLSETGKKYISAAALLS